MTPMTHEIPKGQDPSRCRGCKAIIYWVRTTNDKNKPINPDGTSHFATCPTAKLVANYDPDKDVKRNRQLLLFSQLMGIKHRLPAWERRFIESIAQKFSGKRRLTVGEDSALEHTHNQHY